MTKYTLVLDSSQISLFLECPLQWYLRYVKRLVPSGAPTDNIYMNAGTYGHKLLEIYERSRLKGINLNDSMQKAFDFDPDTDVCECGCNREHHLYLEVIQVTECQRCGKCIGGFKPKPFQLNQDERFAMRNRVRDYIFKWKDNEIVPLSEKHIEVGFSEPIYEDDENLFVLEGRVDLIGKLQGLECIVDHKFQFKRQWLYEKSLQFKNYALVCKKLMFIINYIRMAKTIDNNTFDRTLISFSVPELLAWKKKLIQIFFSIKDARLKGSYEQRWSACKGYGETYDKTATKYCKYTTLCEEPNDDMRLIKENTLYQVNPVEWRPW